MGTVYYLRNPVPGKKYRFKVRARNVYGFGIFSDVASLETGNRPETMIEVVTRNPDAEATKVQINWVAPASSSPITEYELRVLKGSTRSGG